MNVQECITTVEKRWLTRLFLHCKHLFDAVFLPSHDHLHHHRVWEFAKGIIQSLEKTGHGITPGLTEQLIIASFFHDTGLSVTHDERHGAESRRFCEDYMRNSDALISGTSGYRTLLQAIEHHDNKSSQAGSGEGEGRAPGLLEILSGSDDLDALGAIGIYRYAEIYLLRGIPVRDLPCRVIENLDNRFEKLKYTFRDLPDFTGCHISRYRLIHDFYRHLDSRGSSGNGKKSWEKEVMDLIALSLEKKINLMDTVKPMPHAEPKVQSFLRQLHSEIAGFSPSPI